MKKIIYSFLFIFFTFSVCNAATTIESLIPPDSKLPMMTDTIKYSGNINLIGEFNEEDLISGIITKIKDKYIGFVNEEENITLDSLSKDEIDAVYQKINKVYDKTGTAFRLKKSYDKADAYNIHRLFIDYSFTQEYAKIYSLEKMFTVYIQSALSMTNKFEIINTDISKEITEEKVKNLSGLTNKSEKFEAQFSRYVLTGTYTPLNVAGGNFLSVKVIDAVTGEVLYISFTEVNESNIRQNIYREIFTMAGLDYQSDDNTINKKDKSKYVSGFTVKILPNNGPVTAVLYALDTQYKFYTHNIKIPALPAGDYILSIEKSGYVTEQEVLLLFDNEKKDIEIKLRKQYGAIAISSVENDTLVTIDKNEPYLNTKTMYVPRQDIGSHRIKVSKDRYYNQYKTVEVQDGHNTEVNIDLQVKPVKVLFTSNIKGTSVYVDNIFYGITPLIATLVDGEHKVEFKKQYYYSETKNITVDTPEIRIVEGNLSVDNEKYKLKREFYPHFFWELSAYWGVYSYNYLNNSSLYLGAKDGAAMAGNMMYMGGFACSLGIDIEYMFFGVKTLLTLYNNDPQWANSTRSLALALDVIPYFGGKVYAGLWTSFDFGIGYDLAILKSEPANNATVYPITQYTWRSLGLFQNYIFLFDISFYNKYKGFVFGFETMFRLDIFDSFISDNHAYGYSNPGMLYAGIKFPLCYTSSKRRQQSKDYASQQEKEKQDNDIDKLLNRINHKKTNRESADQDNGQTQNE